MICNGDKLLGHVKVLGIIYMSKFIPVPMEIRSADRLSIEETPSNKREVLQTRSIDKNKKIKQLLSMDNESKEIRVGYKEEIKVFIYLF